MNEQHKASSFSEKEIAVFLAVERLIERGKEAYELRVADIAFEAGIGKGTIYEYFSSKDEILAASIRYHVAIEYERFAELSDRDAPFQSIIFEALTLATQTVNKRLTGIFPLISSLDRSTREAFFDGDQSLEKEFMVHIDEQIEKVLQIGIAEGVIGKKATKDYGKFVLVGVVSAYLQAARQLGQALHENDDQLKAMAWKFLTTALADD